MGKYIMALDQGTTSSRCILFDKKGTICSMKQREFTQYYPEPGWVEHNPMEIWESQLAVARDAMEALHITADSIDSIGITNQRETTIVWNKITAVPIYPAIVWQCRRTAKAIEMLRDEGYEETIKEKTGLVMDAYFSATKVAWILDHVDGAREAAQSGELLFGTVDSWLIWNLTKGAVHVTDVTNASRTMLFNIYKGEWDEELLRLFGVPRVMLPTVKPSSYRYGYSEAHMLGGRIPIAGAAGDQQAALFGQCGFQRGSVKNTYGTGCFLLVHTGKEPKVSQNGLITTIAASVQEEIEYALEGSVFVAGAAIQWLRDEMELLECAAQSEHYADMVPHTAGVYVVPAFTGLGAPYWKPYSRGMVTGITRGCKKAHFIRATLEAIAYQTADVLRAMEEDLGITFTELLVDGGASANDFLLQFQADIIGANVCRPKSIETTALGAAYLAGLATGYYKDKEEIAKNWQLGKKFVPQMGEEQKELLLHGWKQAVSCALLYGDEEQ